MKKLMALLLACMTLTCTFASCGDDDDDSSKKKSKKSSSVSDEADDEDEDAEEEDEDDEDDEDEETTKKKRSRSKSESEDEEEETEEETEEEPEETTEKKKNSSKKAESSEEDEEEPEETTAAPAVTAPATPLEVTSDNLLVVDPALFGKSHDEIEDILDADLGAPEDFPWWSVHQTLYYYVDGGVTYLLLFNDADELDVVQLDIKIDFDMDVVEAAEAKYGIEPVVSTGNHSDIYEFKLTDNYINFAIYEEQYSETLEYWFRQSYTSGLYYY